MGRSLAGDTGESAEQGAKPGLPDLREVDQLQAQAQGISRRRKRDHMSRQIAAVQTGCALMLAFVVLVVFAAVAEARAKHRRAKPAPAVEQPPRPDESDDAEPCDRWHRLSAGSVAGTWRTSDNIEWTLWVYRHPLMPESAQVWARKAAVSRAATQGRTAPVIGEFFFDTGRINSDGGKRGVLVIERDAKP